MATYNSKEGDKEEVLMVSAEEVEKNVRQVMELEEGKVLRERKSRYESDGYGGSDQRGVVLHSLFQAGGFLELRLML